VSWLSFLAALMGLLVAGALLQYLVSFSNLKLLQDLAILAIHLSALWLVSGLVYKALRNPQLFEAFAGEEVLLADDATEKYRNSTLSQSDGDRYEAKLNEHIKSDRPYLDTSITLKKLALDLDIPMRHLSQVINQRHGMSFFDFMNAFRVAHFQDLAALPENRETTVLGLMYEAGFQSKSSFNKAFKKSTGTTPTQFLNGLRGSGTSGRRG
jgi:AraC-like DNA-binding protein